LGVKLFKYWSCITYDNPYASQT